MDTKKIELKKRVKGYSVIQTESTLGFKNYTVINENTKKYHTISIAQNTTLNESANDEIFYIIKESGRVNVNENLFHMFPNEVISVFISDLNENEEYISQENSPEVIDYLSHTFNEVGYKVRHVIHYDDIEDSLDYEFLIIVAGDLETLYISVKENGNIYVIEDEEEQLLGDTESPEYLTASLSKYLNDMEHYTAMVNEDTITIAIKESFNQTHGIFIENRIAKIYNKTTSKTCGYIDRRTGVYKLSEDVLLYGIENLKTIVEGYEIKQLLK